MNKMSDLLIDYAGSPKVVYKWNRHPKGQLIALPVWERNWFHHTENDFEPTPPSRHEIRKASIELAKLSFALKMTEDARREETRREQIGRTTHVEYEWLNMRVYVNEERDEITACQLGVFDGWRINVPFSKFRESGKDLVAFALEMKKKATSESQ